MHSHSDGGKKFYFTDTCFQDIEGFHSKCSNIKYLNHFDRVLSKIEIASLLFIFLFLLFPYIKTWYFGSSNAFLDVLGSLVIHSLNKSV